MRLVMDRLGVSSTAALHHRLVELGALEPKDFRKVPKWVGGYNAPDHAATLAILRAAGMLSEEGAGGDNEIVALAQEIVMAADRLASAARQLSGRAIGAPTPQRRS